MELETVSKGRALEEDQECVGHPFTRLLFPLLVATPVVFGKDGSEITQDVLNPDGFLPMQERRGYTQKTFGSWY